MKLINNAVWVTKSLRLGRAGPGVKTNTHLRTGRPSLSIIPLWHIKSLQYKAHALPLRSDKSTQLGERDAQASNRYRFRDNPC